MKNNNILSKIIVGSVSAICLLMFFTITEDTFAAKCMIDTSLFGTCAIRDTAGDWCNTDGNDNDGCWVEQSMSNISVCVVNQTSYYDTEHSTYVGTTLQSDGNCMSFSQCKESKCSSDTSLIDNGDYCWVSKKEGSLYGGEPWSAVTKTQGKWDESESKCVQCDSNNKEYRVCGDTTGTYYNTGTCTGTADNQFESACSVTVSASCDEQIEGHVCATNKECNASGQCVAVATCDTDPTVTITPITQSGSTGTELSYTIKVTNNDDASCTTTSRTFSITRTSVLNAGWSDNFPVSLVINKNSSLTTTYKLTSSATATAGNYQFTIKASDATGDDSKSGIYTITDCPAGITLGGNFKFLGVPPKALGESLGLSLNNTTAVNHHIYLRNPSGSGGDDVIINSGSSAMLTYNLLLTDPIGMWQGYVGTTDCKILFEVVGGAAACTPNGGGCGGNGDCCSNNCNGGVCAVNCTTTENPEATCDDGADNDCDGYIDCYDLDCNGSSCGGSNFCDGGICVECLTDSDCSGATPVCNTSTKQCLACLTNADCADGEVCDGSCIPCSGEGVFETNPLLCCSGLNLLDGVCTSACDPSASFFCNPFRQSVETLVEGGEKMIGYILGLIGSVALLLVIIAGIMYMTSAGNEEKVASSKKILTGAAIGLGIALLAFSLLQVVLEVLNM